MDERLGSPAKLKVLSEEEYQRLKAVSETDLRLKAMEMAAELWIVNDPIEKVVGAAEQIYAFLKGPVRTVADEKKEAK